MRRDSFAVVLAEPAAETPQQSQERIRPVRFLFSDVRNDAEHELHHDRAGNYRMSLATYAEAVAALVRVVEATYLLSEACDRDEPDDVTGPLQDAVLEALDLFEFAGMCP